MKKIQVILFLLEISLGVLAQIPPKDISVALLRQDAVALLNIYNDQPEKKVEVEDAFLTGIDLSKCTFEQIDKLYCLVNESSALGIHLFKLREGKKMEIINELTEYTAEEITSYISEYPVRKELIDSFLNRTIMMYLDSLSYKELSYIGSKLLEDDSVIVENKKLRTNEIRDILQESVYKYCAEEAALSNSLLYKIEKSLWIYLFDGYKEVANYYSQIGMIPDDVTLAAKQYNSLVKTCIPVNRISEKLSLEAEQYCDAINKARARYVQLIGKSKFPKLEIIIPDLDFSYNQHSQMLAGVSKARKKFVDDREAVNDVANVASLFVGFWATLGRGMLDLMAVSDLSSKEINCRQEYMQMVLKELTENITFQNAEIMSNVKKQLKQNQDEFINYINN